MTDKQIIIDGVDVSGCEWFQKWNSRCSLFDGPCGGHSKCDSELSFNCYYKQLKRLEKKLEKIKQFRHDYCMNCEDLLKPSHSCKGCNMVELKHLIEEQIK